MGFGTGRVVYWLVLLRVFGIGVQRRMQRVPRFFRRRRRVQSERLRRFRVMLRVNTLQTKRDLG